ncbi:retrovirus-related pol polyprotein from transposon TNT 1-94 [Tanacetum coccineum]
MSVKHPNYVNLTSLSKEQPNERTPSPPPRKKSLSPPQASSKSISSKSTHYTSSSSLSESPTPNHIASSPKLCFVIPIKQEPQELPPLQISPNDPYAQTIDNWPPGPSNPYPPPRVLRPPTGFSNPPPGFEPLPSTQPLFVNINNNTPLLHNNVLPLENIHYPPPNLGNQDFPNPPNILDFVHLNNMPHLHNMRFDCIYQAIDSLLQLFDSVKNGPFKFGTVEVPATPNTPASTRDGTLDDLTSEEEISLVVPKFLPTDDPIESLNKAMTFLSTAITSRYPQTNNKLRTLSNPKNQATIQDGQVIVQYVQGRKTQSYTRNFAKGKATSIGVRNNTGCYYKSIKGNLMLQLQRKRGLLWMKKNLHFLADTWERFDPAPNAQALTTTGIYQIDDIDALDSDCDEMPTAGPVFMANLYAYDSDVLSEVLNQDTYQDNNVIGDQSVQEMQYFEQPVFVYNLNIDITSDSNAISYDQYMKENESEVVQDTTSSEQQDAMMMSVIEEMSNQVAKHNVVNKEDKFMRMRSTNFSTNGNTEQARPLKPLDTVLDYACKFTTRIQELLVYVSDTCPSSRNDSEKLVAVTRVNKNRQVKFTKPSTSTRVKSSTNASGSGPMSNTRNNRISRTSSSNMKNKIVEVQPRNVKSSANKTNHFSIYMCVVDYLNDVNKRARAKSIKSVKKNEWTPTWLIVTRCWTQWLPLRKGVFTVDRNYVEGLGYNLFLVGQFYDSDLEVAFQKHSCCVRDLEGVDLLNGSRGTNLYTLSLEDMLKSSPICLLSKASKSNGNSLLHPEPLPNSNKTPYELVHDRKSYLKYPHVFGALCYPTNDSEDLGKMKPKADIDVFIGYSPAKKAYRIYNKRTRLIMETIHVKFDELTTTNSEQFSSGLAPQLLTSGQISSRLVQTQFL